MLIDFRQEHAEAWRKVPLFSDRLFVSVENAGQWLFNENAEPILRNRLAGFRRGWVKRKHAIKQRAHLRRRSRGVQRRQRR